MKHTHICSCGEWQCNQNKSDCTLSRHASCGQKIAHNYSFCIQGKNFGPKQEEKPTKATDKPAKSKIKKLPKQAPKQSTKTLKKAA